MKVVDLNGRESHWQLAGHTTKRENCSSLHTETRHLLKEIYPNIQILEEVPIRIYAKKTLYLDFYLPMYHKAIEVHGQQHYVFSKHFHESAYLFKKTKLNDELKEEWCVKNGISLVVLPWNRKEEWKALILI